jgi:hypothetical protein
MTIKNQYLKENIYNTFSKKMDEDISENELKKIKSIVINNVNEKLERIHYDAEDFECIKYVEKLIIQKLTITNEIMQKINNMQNLKSISFNYCRFENNIQLVNNIETLIVVCPEKFDFKNHVNLNKVTFLKLINVDNIDINDLMNYEIEELYLYNCTIKSLKELTNLESLRILKLDGSKFDDDALELLKKKNIVFQYNQNYCC